MVRERKDGEGARMLESYDTSLSTPRGTINPDEDSEAVDGEGLLSLDAVDVCIETDPPSGVSSVLIIDVGVPETSSVGGDSAEGVDPSEGADTESSSGNCTLCALVGVKMLGDSSSDMSRVEIAVCSGDSVGRGSIANDEGVVMSIEIDSCTCVGVSADGVEISGDSGIGSEMLRVDGVSTEYESSGRGGSGIKEDKPAEEGGRGYPSAPYADGVLRGNRSSPMVEGMVGASDAEILIVSSSCGSAVRYSVRPGVVYLDAVT